MSVFGVFLVRIFSHSYWIWRDTETFRTMFFWNIIENSKENSYIEVYSPQIYWKETQPQLFFCEFYVLFVEHLLATAALFSYIPEAKDRIDFIQYFWCHSFKSCRTQMSYIIATLKNFAEFRRKHLPWFLFLVKTSWLVFSCKFCKVLLNVFSRASLYSPNIVSSEIKPKQVTKKMLFNWNII